MTCPGCHRSCIALIHSTHRLQYRSGVQLVEWDECWGCYSKAEARAVELKREAEEDRKIKLPPERKRTTTAQPFIAQIDGAD